MTHDPARKRAFDDRVARARAAAQRGMASLVRELIPGGRRAGNSWVSLPPHRQSDNANAFAVYIHGEKAGGWMDFVTQETGDLFKLVRLVKGHGTFMDSLVWIEDRFGLARMSDDERARLNREIAKREAVADAEAEAAIARRVQRACHDFSEAEKAIAGTPVETYWRARAIDLAGLPHLETRWLRYMPRYPHFKTPGRPSFPCQFAAFTDARGVMRALHVTYLRHDGRGKAPVESPKLMFGPVKGAVIRINRGTGDGAQPVIIAEGVEDALSLAMLEPEMRVWAAGSLGNYLEVPDLAEVSAWMIARDNDWGKAEPAQVFNRAERRFRKTGKPVRVVTSPVGKDFNDYLRHEKEQAA